MTDPLELRFHLATSEFWPDVERLFGAHGAYGGCWCMWWRLSRAEFARQTAEERRVGLQTLCSSGRPPGILAYCGDEPIGWCSVAPREEYPSLERSRTLRRVDDRPAWAIVCFFVHRRFRRQGVMTRLVAEAVRYAVSQGAQIVEAYPHDAGGPELAPVSIYMGSSAVLRAAGFREEARRSKNRPLMRLYADPERISDGR